MLKRTNFNVKNLQDPYGKSCIIFLNQGSLSLELGILQLWNQDFPGSGIRVRRISGIRARHDRATENHWKSWLIKRPPRQFQRTPWITTFDASYGPNFYAKEFDFIRCFICSFVSFSVSYCVTSPIQNFCKKIKTVFN